MAIATDKLSKLLEENAVAIRPYAEDNALKTYAALSTAMSLKRIADYLEKIVGTDDGQ